jgi:hypothetical protein
VETWTAVRILRELVAAELLREINELYASYVGGLVGPDGAPVPIRDRIVAVAQANVVPWIFMAGGYVAIAKVPERLAHVITVRELASLVGGWYSETERVALVKPDTLESFLTERNRTVSDLLGQTG